MGASDVSATTRSDGAIFRHDSTPMCCLGKAVVSVSFLNAQVVLTNCHGKAVQEKIRWIGMEYAEPQSLLAYRQQHVDLVTWNDATSFAIFTGKGDYMRL